MKKQFQRIIIEHGCEIVSWNTYRSDMGCQVYEVRIKLPSGVIYRHDDSYSIGEPKGREQVIDYFKKQLDSKLTQCK